MTKVVAIMSMSLDGYVADANDGVAEVFDWYFSGDVEVPTAEHGIGHDVPRLGAERRPPEGLDGRDRRHAHRSAHVRARRRLGRPAPVGCARLRRHPPRARRLATARLDRRVRHRRHRKRRCSSEIGRRPEVRARARRPNDPAVPGRRAARRDPHRSGCRVARQQECGCSTTSRTHRPSSGIRQSSPVWGSRICAIPCTRRRSTGRESRRAAFRKGDRRGALMHAEAGARWPRVTHRARVLPIARGRWHAPMRRHDDARAPSPTLQRAGRPTSRAMTNPAPVDPRSSRVAAR